MKHKTKHHAPIVKLPDDVFWKRVRERRGSEHVPAQTAMYEVIDLPVGLPDGANYTAAPRGRYMGNGTYRAR